MEWPPKKPKVIIAMPVTIAHSDALAVSTTPASMITKVVHSTRWRPSLSATLPIHAELATPTT